jgi:hypothetical protein
MYQHFYENALNSIRVEGVTHLAAMSGPVSMNLATIASTLTVNRGGTMLDRAKQQFLGLLLNVASGKLLTSSVVSVDGATASQAMQHVATAINDGDSSNDELAKDIAEQISNAQIVPAGKIDLDIEHIPYKAGLRTAVLAVGPSPTRGAVTLSFQLERAEPVCVRVYSVAGGLVREMSVGQLPAGRHSMVWDGRDDQGRQASAGVYWVRAQLGNTGGATRRVVLLR